MKKYRVVFEDTFSVEVEAESEHEAMAIVKRQKKWKKALLTRPWPRVITDCRDLEAEPQRKMYRGNWKCGGCGKAINSLPFEPNPARIAQLRCWDCHQRIEQEEWEKPLE